MNRPNARFVACLPAALAISLVFIYPIAGLVFGLLTNRPDSPLSNPVTGRMLEILFRTVAMSAAAAVTSTLFAWPAATVLARLGNRLPRSILGVVMLATILSPPMVYAFGWHRIMPQGIHPTMQCVLVWTLWSWPISAWFVGTAIARVNQQTREAALLDASHWPLLRDITLPQLVPGIALNLLVVFTLLLGEYGTPHAFGLQVISTELMAIAQSCNTPTNTIVASIPSVAIIMVALGALMRAWSGNAIGGEFKSLAVASNMRGFAVLGALYFFISWLIPIAKLVSKMKWSDMTESWTIYAWDLVATVGVATAAAVLSIIIGLLVSANRRIANGTMVLAVIWGAVPGVLVGEALIASFNRPVVGWIYDRWPIVALSYLLHFGWIGIAAVLLARQSLPREIEEEAAIEGASDFQFIVRVLVPNTWPAMTIGAGVIVVLSIADMAASTLVRVPSYNPISHVIIEKFHRLEDGMMIALCLNLIAVVVLVTGLTSYALALRQRNKV